MILYELELNDNGVDAIAIVDRPAIQSDFQAFADEPMRFEIVNEEERIVSGYLMIADKPIFRDDEVRGKHYIVFRSNVIKKCVERFMENGMQSNINLMHDQNLKLSDVFLYESLVVDSKKEKYAPKSFKIEADGSWWGTMKVNNEEVWQSIKDGKFKGFSVEGFFKYGMSEDEKKLQQLKNLFQK